MERGAGEVFEVLLPVSSGLAVLTSLSDDQWKWSTMRSRSRSWSGAIQPVLS